jgi:putative DNA modification/repair radical SAM protein
MSIHIEEKIAILTGAAKYDVSCASSGSSRRGEKGCVGTAMRSGICHSWSDDGRCISLLKILMSNRCIYDCAYCVNRSGNSVPRTSLTVEEVVSLTISFYRRNYIEGLFLSSGIEVSPDATMARMLRIVKRLRETENFHGYIHLKAIPGADPSLILSAGQYADRMSVNIELPSAESLHRLAPDKSKNDILLPMRQIGNEITANRDERKRSRKAPHFVPAGQSTQLIVSASPETDRKILSLSESLYASYGLKRVYYSAYAPVGDTRRIEWQPGGVDMIREHRLYQADWLLRYYGFNSQEILSEKEQELERDIDPKAAWALRHPELFPVEIMSAEYENLLRVPGLGVQSAKRILSTRRIATLRFKDLYRIGVVMKRAQFFITINGKMCVPSSLSYDTVRTYITPHSATRTTDAVQPDLFATVAEEV